MTVQEMQALPIGPEFGMRTEIIDGRKMNIPVAPDVVASFVGEDEPMGYSDETGVWAVGQYRDGSWFRRLVG